MQLLLDEDYEILDSQGLAWREIADKRFLILKGVALPRDMYTVASADFLVVVPTDYPQGGIDMFWTSPRLVRTDGTPIPQTSEPGGGENHQVENVEFCRWSRHWFSDMPSVWRPNLDNVSTIIKRIIWAVTKPPLL